MSLHDHHTHLSLYAALQGCPSLASGGTEAHTLALLRAQRPDRLSTVLGWRRGMLSLSGRLWRALPPVLLVDASLHGLCLTPAAEELLRGSHPELVERHRDAVWCERNAALLQVLGGAHAGLTAEMLDAFLVDLERLDVASADDMLLTGEAAWQLLRASRWGDRARVWTTHTIFRTLSVAAQSDIAGFKVFLDGALGARTAALSARHGEAPAGMLLSDDAALDEELALLCTLGRAMALHAIGDRAVEQAIAALERLARSGLRFGLARIEHAQFITEAAGRRAKDLGIVLSMQPNFGADSIDYADRLGPRWLEANNPFRMLIDTCGFVPGKDLLFGSDGMPHGIEAAGRWSIESPFGGQRLTSAELLAGYGAPPVPLAGQPRTWYPPST